MSLKFFDKLFQDFSKLANNKREYNVEESENAPTNENLIKTIIKPNISYKYIFGGVVNIENSDTKTVYELMINANELELKELSEKSESYLIESKASWLRTHLSLIYHLIFDSNEFKGLKKIYNKIIAKYSNLIFELKDFTLFQETVLISILQRDDLKVEEIKIWNYVIKWGIAQNSTLPTNSEE
ncbi:hypothetical protein Glove_320g135 [Diversispora epigaea]|uniref:BACK domain-containing protein n=1 Tax=Diversispora epigaea TaxID=1348612 RepID=A0A397HNS3_9GLOM|nr:hypothetical protein Glove_320g135 [Diversispora epigaea]